MTRHRRHLMWQRVPTHNTKGGEMNVHRTRGVGVLVAAAALFALAVSAPARADTVTDWNAIARPRSSARRASRLRPRR